MLCSRLALSSKTDLQQQQELKQQQQHGQLVRLKAQKERKSENRETQK
jgi:hypothetical protein